MQNVKPPKLLNKYIFLLWLHITIVLFLILPGRYTYLQYAQIYDWQLLTYKLIRIDFLGFINNQLFALLYIFIFVIVCISFGLTILHLLKITRFFTISKAIDLTVFLATAFTLGQGVLAIIFIGLGNYDLLISTNVFLILIVSFLTGILPLTILLKSLVNKNIIQAGNSISNNEKLLLGLSFFIVVLSMFLTTSRLSYDAVAVYFSDAKLTALLHKIAFFRHGAFNTSNFLSGIIFSILIQVFNDQTARLFSWLSGCAVIIFSTALAGQLGLSRRAKIILITLILSTTAFVDLMGDGKVDLQSTSLAISAVYWLVLSLKVQAKPLLLLTGFLAGLAMIARPYNIPLLTLFFALYYCIQTIRNRKERALLSSYNLSNLLIIGAGVFFLGIVYLLMNWMLLGSPIAPLQATNSISSQSWQWAFDENDIWSIRFLYPIAITFINSPQSLGNISPLIVGFLPIILIKEIRKKTALSKTTIYISFTAIIVLIAWIMSIFTVFEIRYVLFLWFILYIPTSAIIASIEDTQRLQFRKIIESIIIILLVYMSVRVFKIVLDTYAPINNEGYAQCYDLPYCDLELEINKIASPGDRVLTLNAYRYYLAPPLLSCSTGPDEYVKLQNASSSTTNFWTEVYKQGYNYVAYEKNYSTRHLKIELVPDPNNTPSWIKLKTIYISDSGDEAVYEIQANNPVININKTCQQSEPGIWVVQNAIE